MDLTDCAVHQHKSGRWGTGPERDQIFLDELLKVKKEESQFALEAHAEAIDLSPYASFKGN